VGSFPPISPRLAFSLPVSRENGKTVRESTARSKKTQQQKQQKQNRPNRDVKNL